MKQFVLCFILIAIAIAMTPFHIIGTSLDCWELLVKLDGEIIITGFIFDTRRHCHLKGKEYRSEGIEYECRKRSTR